MARRGHLRGIALLLTVAALLHSASAGLLPPLPLILSLPSDCGAVYQVQEGDSCQSIADYGGISLTEYSSLNLLSLCGVLTPTPGSLVCVGDHLAFCSSRYVTAANDTCDTITEELKALPFVPGATCSTLIAGTELCLLPEVNPCANDTLCGVSISSDLQNLLGSAPDYCSIISSCEGNLTAGSTDNLPSVTLTLTDVTPAVQNVVGNDGHPELTSFATSRASGPAQIDVTFVPGGHDDGSHIVASSISTGSSTRKLLGTATRGTQARYPRANYGYGRR